MEKLTPDQQSALEKQLRGARDIYERNRLCVVLVRDEGYAPDVIATILCLNRESVLGYLRDYEKKGIRKKTLQTIAKQKRLHFLGALKLTGMEIVTEEYSPTIGQDQTIDFLKKLELRSGTSRIHVILDNARSNRNKALATYLETLSICVHYLPPYSSNLNPIERLWKFMREKTTYNIYHEKFNLIDEFSEILIQWPNDNFQTIANPVSLS